jgi:hypothetical protein
MSAYIVDRETFPALKEMYYQPMDPIEKHSYMEFMYALVEVHNNGQILTNDQLFTAMHNLASLNVASVSNRYSEDNQEELQLIDALLAEVTIPEIRQISTKLANRKGYLYGVLSNLSYQCSEIDSNDPHNKYLDILNDYRNAVARSIADNDEDYSWGI